MDPVLQSKVTIAETQVSVAENLPYLPVGGLSANVEIFKQKVFAIFYNAFIAEVGDDLPADGDGAMVNCSDANLQIKANAVDKAQIISDGLGDAVTNYIKTMQVSLNTVPPTVISPSGPCTGSIPFTFFQII